MLSQRDKKRLKQALRKKSIRKIHREFVEEKLRKKLRKVISLTATVDSDGSVWGMDTDCGNIEKLLNEAMKIMKEED